MVDVGFGGMLVDIDCHISNGLPEIAIVGFANKAADEWNQRTFARRFYQQQIGSAQKTYNHK